MPTSKISGQSVAEVNAHVLVHVLVQLVGIPVGVGMWVLMEVTVIDELVVVPFAGVGVGVGVGAGVGVGVTTFGGVTGAGQLILNQAHRRLFQVEKVRASRTARLATAVSAAAARAVPVTAADPIEAAA